MEGPNLLHFHLAANADQTEENVLAVRRMWEEYRAQGGKGGASPGGGPSLREPPLRLAPAGDSPAVEHPIWVLKNDEERSLRVARARDVQIRAEARTGNPEIDIELEEAFAKRLGELATEFVGEQLGMMLDDRLLGCLHIAETKTRDRLEALRLAGLDTETVRRLAASLLVGPPPTGVKLTWRERTR